MIGGMLPAMIRSQVFTNQLSNYYPRFNVTINGVEYFVLDPSPVVDRLEWGMVTQQAMYRYPNTVDCYPWTAQPTRLLCSKMGILGTTTYQSDK